MTTFIEPPNTLKIEELWAFVSRDAEGNEGVCAFTTPGGMAIPMIAADQSRIDQLMPITKQLARQTRNSQIHLVKFHVRKDVRVIRPD